MGFVRNDSTHTSENRELFGHLVQEMHQLIDSDEDVRRRIHAVRSQFRPRLSHGPLRSLLTAEEVSRAAACKELEVPQLTEKEGGRSRGSSSVPVLSRDLDTIIVHNLLQENKKKKKKKKKNFPALIP